MKLGQSQNSSTRGNDRWKKINWLMLVFIAGIGVLVVGLIGLGFSRSTNIYRKLFPLVDATLEMRMETISAYLWFEELIGGNEETNIDNILKNLDQADWYANAMIEGGRNVHLDISPNQDPEVQNKVKKLQAQLKAQRSLLMRRFDQIHTSRTGSEIDKQYHSLLEDFIVRSKALEAEIKGNMDRHYQHLKLIWLGVFTCCLCLFVAFGMVFYRYEHQRRNHYLEFIKMQAKIVQNEKLATLGKMITGIAHEVNNPNNFISFNLPILKNYIDGMMPIVDTFAHHHPDLELSNMPYEEFRKDIHTIIRNVDNGAKRINRMVSNLKEFARKKDEKRKDWINIGRVINKTVAIFQPTIEHRTVSLEIEISDDLPDLFCDAEIIQSITINFLHNAAEAADKDNAFIKLNAHAEPKSNAAIIEVEDNGCGISKSDHDRIFDPFYSTKSSQGHAGLGLYLCRTLADQIDAEIGMQSQAGKGSTFRLKLSLEEMASKQQ